MNRPWQRQRQPDDVPTPVAVAVSDYCRRAHSPATPTEVREALALLAESDDFRVRTLTDAEPGATPLGPFAVVDVLQGTAPALAATRQGCGYYDVVRELARVHEEKRPPAPPVPDVPTFALPPPRVPAAESPTARKEAVSSGGETVQARIAPRKRSAPVSSPAELGEDQDELGFLKRDLPKPRGRFTRLEAPKSNFQELTRAPGKDVLVGLMEAHPNRFALHKAVAQQYNGPRGELSLGELEQVLEEHELLETLGEREHAAILSAFTEHRGAAGRVGWALGLSPSELKQLEAKLGISERVEEVRERFRREALTGRNLTQKLDLLGREKYLIDLGIKKRFSDMLRRELEVLVREEGSHPGSLSALSDAIARKHGAPSELVLRALERLGVTERGPKRTPPDSTS
jgi:hypothetical protein